MLKTHNQKLAKIFLWAAALLLVIGLAIQFSGTANTATDLAETFYHDGEIKLTPRMSAGNILLAPYKVSDIFTSEVQESDFDFSSVGAYWREYSPSGTGMELFIRIRSGGQWSPWLKTDEEVRSENGDYKEKYALASANSSQAVQYRIMMYGDGIHTPTINNLEWTFIRAGDTVSTKARPVPQFASSSAASYSTYIALNASNAKMNVISRTAWGANESYRYLEDNNSEPDLVKLDPDFYDKYKNELKYSKTVNTDTKGNKYKWPLAYPDKVRKIIIHHTATTGNLSDPKQAIRDIYYYHSIVRGWGDIGYNYLIDQQGKVYEGRYGGEGVIGAHAGPGNHGSIGIALLGDYETNEVPDAAMAGLIRFIGEKAGLHKIDTTGSSEFRGLVLSNVIGHKDIMRTTCPGKNIYSKLPMIRTLAKNIRTVISGKNADYAFEDVSEAAIIDISADEIKEVTIKLKNTGTKTWDNKTGLRMRANTSFKNTLVFPDLKTPTLAALKESFVKPGGIGTFKFRIKGGQQSAVVYMDMDLYANGGKNIGYPVSLPVNVEQTSYNYSVVDMKLPPASMQAGEKFSGWVKLKNTGNKAWQRSGTGTVFLLADHERGRESIFNIPKSSKIGILKEDSVKPGEVGTFLLNLTAPGKAGYYQEYFTPVVDWKIWMDDSGLYFDTTVAGDEDIASDLVNTTDLSTWEQGKGYIVWVKLRNMGQSTWTKSNLKVQVFGTMGLDVARAELRNSSVGSGEVGELNLTVHVSPKAALGKKALIIRPSVNGKYVSDTPEYFRYEIVKAAPIVVKPVAIQASATVTAEPKMRVKLSFSGNPELTANSSFTIYSGTEKIASLKKNEKVQVSATSSGYALRIAGKASTKNSPIRIVPVAGGITEISNFEHRPAWNMSLNDNKYRGVLEVNKDNGQLIVINELPLEDYMLGLGEVSNGDPYEKVKAIIVAARTYADYYLTIDQKFPGKPYNLDDDPDTSQKYLGYGFEQRSTTVKKAVEVTKGEVVAYKGKVVKTPYFSQSDGTKTKNAEAVWGWKNTPYLISVDDSFCNSKSFLGHGVGLSGCGAATMAQQGKTYQQILKYYYTGVEIADLW